MKNKVFITRPSMPSYEEYTEAIKPLWDSHLLTNMGVYHQELERQLEKYLNVPKISLMVNGHIALELLLQAMGFPEGGEVITTPFTFVSTTHAIIRNHLLPVFCDVKLSDGTIDEMKIEELITDRTVAILPVHVYGNICNVDAIQEIAVKHKLKVIYDAAHAFGEKYKGKSIANFGDATMFSFHATKVFNTVEGGAVVCKEIELYEKLYNLKNFGIRGEESVVEVGANAKMNELSAIMGLCNLKHLDYAISERKKRYEFYRENLKDVNGIRLFYQDIGIDRNCAYFPIIIEDEYPLSRNELYDLFKHCEIYTRKYFYPITADLDCFDSKFSYVKLDNARQLACHVLAIPIYEDLEWEQMERIVKIIRTQEGK